MDARAPISPLTGYVDTLAISQDSFHFAAGDYELEFIVNTAPFMGVTFTIYSTIDDDTLFSQSQIALGGYYFQTKTFAVTLNQPAVETLLILDFRSGAMAGFGSQFNLDDVTLTEAGLGKVGADEETRTETVMPEKFALQQNYPNPFNPSTTIRYDLPEPAQVRLEIFNILGQRVRVLVDEVQTTGFKEVSWNATDDFGQQVSGGVYIYKIVAGSFIQTRKMLFLK